jgi:hypothetical protein
LDVFGLPTWSKEEASITLSHVLCKCERQKIIKLEAETRNENETVLIR